jgi:hypothetical protein
MSAPVDLQRAYLHETSPGYPLSCSQTVTRIHLPIKGRRKEFVRRNNFILAARQGPPLDHH